MVWLEWQRSGHIPKQKNWDHLIWKWDSFFILTPIRFIPLPKWFSTTLCIKIKLLTSRFFLVWLEWQRSWHIPKQENWDHLIWKCDSFFILIPMRFIPLPGDSPLLYVSKYSFIHRDSSWFDWNDEEAVLLPNWETGITRFESGITSSSQLLRNLFHILMILHYFMYQNQAFYMAILSVLIRMTNK